MVHSDGSNTAPVSVGCSGFGRAAMYAPSSLLRLLCADAQADIDFRIADGDIQILFHRFNDVTDMSGMSAANDHVINKQGERKFGVTVANVHT